MNLLEKLTTRPTGRQRYDDPVPTLLSYKVEKGDINYYTSDRNQEYILKGQLAISFWANKAQYERALRNAKRVLLTGVYETILKEIPRLVHNISNGDKEIAINILWELEELMRGKNI